MDEPAEVASVMHVKWDLGLHGGVLLATPIPAEAEIPAEEINPKIEQAIAEMDAEGIIGKDQTPYLLSRIVEITEGRSLAANIALVYNNAKVAAQVAVAYAG